MDGIMILPLIITGLVVAAITHDWGYDRRFNAELDRIKKETEEEMKREFPYAWQLLYGEVTDEKSD